MIKIEFEFETKHGKYRDALYLLDNHNFTKEQIEEMKVQRVNNWINIVENLPQHVEKQFDQPAE